MPRPKEYSDELRERAVRLVFESGRQITHVTRDLAIHKERCGCGCAKLRSTPAAATIA